MLAEEAHILETLKPHPHKKNLVKYHGILTARNRIVGLALEKYDIILQYRFEDDARELDIRACINGLPAGIQRLHSSEHAHNNLNPTNIALDGDDEPVILDFGSCGFFGEGLVSGMTPGWVDEDYSTSSPDQALGALGGWRGGWGRDGGGGD